VEIGQSSPDWARRGLGTLLLEACESAARAAGFRRFELGATLTGVHLYEKRGYEAVDRVEVPLPGGQTVPVVRIVKTKSPTCSRSRLRNTQSTLVLVTAIADASRVGFLDGRREVDQDRSAGMRRLAGAAGRVAAGVGEGSMAIAFVHAYLASLRSAGRHERPSVAALAAEARR